MIDLLSNKHLALRPATLRDKRIIFEWLTNSNLTCEMMGPPHYPDAPIPTWEEFDNDYEDHYFNSSQPWGGQCFVLVHEGQEIGQINYNPIDPETKSTEIDIWLADRKYTGKGLGTLAITMLCTYLKTAFSCTTVYIAPSRRNKVAIKSYKKAGFIESEQVPDNFVPDYDDAVLMVKYL